jgi:hypothetical protein
MFYNYIGNFFEENKAKALPYPLIPWFQEL